MLSWKPLVDLGGPIPTPPPGTLFYVRSIGEPMTSTLPESLPAPNPAKMYQFADLYDLPGGEVRAGWRAIVGLCG